MSAARPPALATPMAWARSAARALPLVLVLASVGSAAPEKPSFWREREAAYRASPRGPFTAIHVAYLGYRGEENLYVVDGQLVPEPTGRGSALRVNFARPGFLIGPVKAKGFRFATMRDLRARDGTRTVRVRDEWFVGPEAGDSLDIRVGPFLVSLDMQDEKTGRVLVYDPELLADFHGFDVFPYSRRFRVTARVLPADGATVELGTSRGLTKDYVRAAILEFRMGWKECRLFGFRAPDDDATSPLFVPFRDATSGDGSYGSGRYLRVVVGGDRAVLDFHRATNPWCAYSPFYNCVLPPPENELPVPIRAGERAPAGH